ncbi:hypothetical protein [Luteitalea sp.]
MRIPMLFVTFALAAMAASPATAHPARVPHRHAAVVRPVVVAPVVVPVRRALVPVVPVRRALVAPVVVAARPVPVRPVLVRPVVRPRVIVRY